MSAAQDTLSKKNLELQAARADAVKATDKRVVLDKLAVVSANLSFIEEVLRNQRSTAAEAVKELDAKVAAAKKRIGPPDAPDRIIEVFFRETERVFLAAVWPAVVVGIVLYLLLSKAAPGRLRAMFKGFKSFELGGTGAKIEFSSSEEAKATMEAAFQSYRDEAKLQYD